MIPATYIRVTFPQPGRYKDGKNPSGSVDMQALTCIQSPNGFGPRHASSPAPGYYLFCYLFVSVRVTLRAHSALTSAIRRTRRRHRPHIFLLLVCFSLSHIARALRTHPPLFAASAAATGPVFCFATCLFQSESHCAQITFAIYLIRRRHGPRILFCCLFVSVQVTLRAHCALTPRYWLHPPQPREEVAQQDHGLLHVFRFSDYKVLY